jgi:hypothetical protein
VGHFETRLCLHFLAHVTEQRLETIHREEEKSCTHRKTNQVFMGSYNVLEIPKSIGSNLTGNSDVCGCRFQYYS